MPVIAKDSYKQLLIEVRPEVIDTEAQYDQISERLSELVRKGGGRSLEETRLMKLLGLLVEDYDRRHSLPASEMAPQEALRFLMEQSGKTPTDLLTIFGQRSHVAEALNATRKISAEQARKLGKLFRVNPGVFI
jgi:antitoxin component HigA of HigAB toxin-antitoxin module